MTAVAGEGRGSGQGAALLTSLTGSPGRPQGAAQQVAQGASPRGAVAYGGVQVSRQLPRRGRGGQEAAWQSVHTGGQRRAAWAWEGQLGLVGVRGRPFGTHQGDFGHARYAGRDAQAPGQLLLQEVPYADDHLLARGGLWCTPSSETAT